MGECLVLWSVAMTFGLCDQRVLSEFCGHHVNSTDGVPKNLEDYLNPYVLLMCQRAGLLSVPSASLCHFEHGP